MRDNYTCDFLVLKWRPLEFEIKVQFNGVVASFVRNVALSNNYFQTFFQIF
jgi:hypothetical protein